MKREWVKVFLVVVLSLTVKVRAQPGKQAWKEYVFPEDGFAIAWPYKLQPHPALVIPNANAYAVMLPGGATVVLRVTHRDQPRDCNSVLRLLKNGVVAGKAPGAEVSTLKELSIDGFPGLEYLWQHGDRTDLERYYCVTGRMYVFSAGRASNTQFPAAVTRILNSFRLLNEAPPQP